MSKIWILFGWFFLGCSLSYLSGFSSNHSSLSKILGNLSLDVVFNLSIIRVDNR